MIKYIEQKISSGERLTREEGQWLFQHADNTTLSLLSTQVKARYHDPKSATYLIMAIINYTNVCVAKCDYCAFYKLPHEKGTYLLGFDELCERIDRLLEYGGQLVGFNGGFHPKLKLLDYAELFARLRSRYGNQLEFYEMTIAEFMFSCKVSKLSYEEGALLLKAHGTRWVTGGGAEILDDNFRRRHSPGKYTVDDYFRAQTAIIEAGLGSSATMVIGFDETLEERFNHLDRVRSFQDQTGGGLNSFLCWTYKPHNTTFGGQEISAQEYVRWLAISRIYLDNIKYIRASVLTQNENALLGLNYGADDFDLPTEDEVTQKAGANITLDFEQILSSARNLGFVPQKRNPFPIPTRHFEQVKNTPPNYGDHLLNLPLPNLEHS